jgi:predicted transcriptional regulator
MSAVVQARLDRSAQQALEQLVRQRGWSRSRVVREAIMRLADGASQATSQPVAGLGGFASGVPDLGSNPDRLRGFGR